MADMELHGKEWSLRESAKKCKVPKNSIQKTDWRRNKRESYTFLCQDSRRLGDSTESHEAMEGLNSRQGF